MNVTKHRVDQLLGGYLMNGVGPAQLTLAASSRRPTATAALTGRA
jgi:hypothetical protein